ncbi:tripartite tricarboxylate transporter TctB family protein [Shouchella clausii]|uniref:DUF1468 domain-containing protein n=1 Tax=Shouchella clausii (strain KSM-K16) TaxID=66692 RepID=Q5WLJ4_SHOC1|nr:tripartite tricarboxylate transporter TctB family protein [Shouchella clausii]KKI86304.1 hypothetical protein WZ76_11090 [Shouchella clausii]BAD62761.1 hypothetical protein ABC0218 [Shouchella clausii KSM-K16]
MKRYSVQLMFIVFSILLFVNGITSVKTQTIREDLLNQRDYMLIIAAMIFAFSLLSILLEFRKANKEHTEAPSFGINKKVVVIIGATFLFALGATFVGFFTSTALFTFAITFYLSEKSKANLAKCLSFSLGLTVVLFIVFDLISVFFPNTLLI